MVALVQTLANSKATLPHRPFLINKFVPQRQVNERGAFVLGTVYNFGDQVEWEGYSFIANADNLTSYPIDPATKDPSAGWAQPWQSCYQRVRDALHEALLDPNFSFELFRQSISGQWPCQIPDINYNNIEFYFPETGFTESVSINGNSGQNPPISVGTIVPAITQLPLGAPIAFQDPIPARFPCFLRPRSRTDNCDTNIAAVRNIKLPLAERNRSISMVLLKLGRRYNME